MEDLTRLKAFLSGYSFPKERELSFGDQIGFGLEVEMAGPLHYDELNSLLKMLKKINRKYEGYKVKKESTCSGEIATGILYNTSSDWNDFRYLLQILVQQGAYVSGKVASHIHVSTSSLSSLRYFTVFLKSMVLFAPVLFRFGYGMVDYPRPFLRYRPTDYNFAVLNNLYEIQTFIAYAKCCHYEVQDWTEYERYFDSVFHTSAANRCAFNFNSVSANLENKDNHLEFRFFNGTLSFLIWQNNVNVVLSMFHRIRNCPELIYAIEQMYAKTPISYYPQEPNSVLFKESYNSMLESFSKDDYEMAVLFANLFLSSTEDKILFLKQYLKCFSNEELEEQHRLCFGI